MLKKSLLIFLCLSLSPCQATLNYLHGVDIDMRMDRRDELDLETERNALNSMLHDKIRQLQQIEICPELANEFDTEIEACQNRINQLEKKLHGQRHAILSRKLKQRSIIEPNIDLIQISLHYKTSGFEDLACAYNDYLIRQTKKISDLESQPYTANATNNHHQEGLLNNQIIDLRTAVFNHLEELVTHNIKQINNPTSLSASLCAEWIKTSQDARCTINAFHNFERIFKACQALEICQDLFDELLNSFYEKNAFHDINCLLDRHNPFAQYNPQEWLDKIMSLSPENKKTDIFAYTELCGFLISKLFQQPTCNIANLSNKAIEAMQDFRSHTSHFWIRPPYSEFYLFFDTQIFLATESLCDKLGNCGDFRTQVKILDKIHLLMPIKYTQPHNLYNKADQIYKFYQRYTNALRHNGQHEQAENLLNELFDKINIEACCRIDSDNNNTDKYLRLLSLPAEYFLETGDITNALKLTLDRHKILTTTPNSEHTISEHRIWAAESHLAGQLQKIKNHPEFVNQKNNISAHAWEKIFCITKNFTYADFAWQKIILDAGSEEQFLQLLTLTKANFNLSYYDYNYHNKTTGPNGSNQEGIIEFYREAYNTLPEQSSNQLKLQVAHALLDACQNERLCILDAEKTKLQQTLAKLLDYAKQLHQDNATTHLVVTPLANNDWNTCLVVQLYNVLHDPFMRNNDLQNEIYILLGKTLNQIPDNDVQNNPTLRELRAIQLARLAQEIEELPRNEEWERDSLSLEEIRSRIDINIHFTEEKPRKEHALELALPEQLEPQTLPLPEELDLELAQPAQPEQLEQLEQLEPQVIPLPEELEQLSPQAATQTITSQHTASTRSTGKAFLSAGLFSILSAAQGLGRWWCGAKNTKLSTEIYQLTQNIALSQQTSWQELDLENLGLSTKEIKTLRKIMAEAKLTKLVSPEEQGHQDMQALQSQLQTKLKSYATTGRLKTLATVGALATLGVGGMTVLKNIRA